VSTNDLLWDGVEWVSHDGLIYRGESEAISFRGLAVTADHKILIDGEWVEAKDADADRVTITGESATVEAAHATGRQSVYDLLNAGPRNRFTVCGSDGIPFIVHNCACAAPPNYQPVADASAEAARISADLGKEQLAEARRQFDATQAVSKPVTDAQLALMNQTKAQGDDYYNYMKSKQRPVEDALNAESMLDTTAADAAERNLITGGDTGVYDARKDDIESQVGRAVSDVRQGTTQQQNQLIRQGLRYGWSPSQIAAKTGASAAMTGLAEASAANSTRNAGIDKARNLMTTGRNMRLQDQATGWAKKLDVAGLYRNLPGASQGAYSLANQSGNSAVQNQMAPGAQLQGAMAQSANTQMSGQQIAMQGLSGILGAQTSYANATNSAMNSGGGGMDGLGSIIGAGVKLYSLSDRRLKDDVVLVGKDEATGLSLYEFAYKDGDGKRFVGVMADEVEGPYPDAVIYDDLGFASVDYGVLGLQMVEA
jgi:hypothetical protein